MQQQDDIIRKENYGGVDMAYQKIKRQYCGSEDVVFNGKKQKRWFFQSVRLWNTRFGWLDKCRALENK